MALADVERIQQEGISNSQGRQVLLWGCLIFFFSSCPLPSLLFPWGLGSTTALIPDGSKPRECLSKTVEHHRPEEICVPRLTPLLIWGSDTAQVAMKTPTCGRAFPPNQPRLATALKHLLKSGKWRFCAAFLSLSCLPVGGISLPPSLFLLQCRKNLFMREIRENKS